MTPAEIAVLGALAPEHPLTAAQIQQAALLTSWRTRNALAHLTSRGLITPSHLPGRWRITHRGRLTLAMKSPRFR